VVRTVETTAELCKTAGVSLTTGKLWKRDGTSSHRSAYLQRAGTPAKPSDLTGHRIISGPASMQATSWHFERRGEKLVIEVRAQISTNDTAGAIAAAMGGLGITSTTSWACQGELDDGLLVRLFPSWKTADLPVHAYFPLGRSTRMSAKAFVDFIIGEFRSSR